MCVCRAVIIIIIIIIIVIVIVVVIICCGLSYLRCVTQVVYEFRNIRAVDLNDFKERYLY